MNYKNVQELMCQVPKIDEEYELYIQAWMAYHRAVNEVDGSFYSYPPIAVRNLAVEAGLAAMDKVLPLDQRPSLVRNNPSPETYYKWNSAKVEALRRMRRSQ